MIKHFNFIEYRKRERPLLKKRIILYSFLILLVISGYLLVFYKIYDQAIYPRVKVADIDLSGLKVDQAKTILNIYNQKLERKSFPFSAKTKLGEKTIYFQPFLMGINDPDLTRQIVNINIQETINKAYSIGHCGNIFQKLGMMITAFRADKNIDLSLTINREEAKKILYQNFHKLEVDIINPHPSIYKNKLILVKGRPGIKLNYQLAVEEFENNLKHFSNQKIIILSETEVPQLKAADCENAFQQINQLISKAPFVLSWRNKKWQFNKSDIISWLEFVKKEDKIELSFNRNKIDYYLTKISDKINIDPINAKFEINNGRVTKFQTSKNGLAIDKEKTITNIISSIKNGNKNIELVVKEVEPKITIENANNLGIKELIGQGVSDFRGSPRNRRHNIEVGATILNGLLIAPDEEFSLVKAIGEVSEKTGFLPELVIKGNRTIPELGGGLCQIGTTAFRVALDAGLPITARTPHTYRVIYYEPAGTDATIYNPQPDFRFINDTNHYILFQTEIDGNKLIFNFYGTSDGRKVEITKPKIFNITSPPPAKFIETDELEPGQKKKVERSIKGADTKFTRTIIFPNNTQRQEIWKSHYKAWPEVWLVGKTKQNDSEINNQINKND